MSVTKSEFWDFVVVGGGLAGSVAGAELGRAGYKVLVIERGTDTGAEPVPRRSLLSKIKAKLFASQTYFHPGWLKQIMKAHISRDDGRVKTLEFPAVLGTGPGGSSTIYGAALGRFTEFDFETDTASREGGLDNRWPFSFAEFRSYYEAAERLMRVHGTPDPLDPTDDGTTLLAPPPIGPRDKAYVDRLQANGLNPYRLHVGFDYKPGCSECLTPRCGRGCKATGASRALRPALAAGHVKLRTGLRVLRIEQEEAGPVVLAENAEGVTERFAAAHVVLAAGALKTPGLLAVSKDIWPQGEPHPLLGRGLMFHGVDIMAVSDPNGAPRFGPQKTLGFRDYYRDGDTPLGEVQSLGLPITTGTVANYLIDEAHRRGFGWLGPALMLARIPAAIGARMFSKASLFATIMEDLPYTQNRVVTDEKDPDRIEIEYHVPAEMKARATRMRELIPQGFAPFHVSFHAPLAIPNWGHPCGTARMGQEPETSVTTPDGQLWANPDITIVDASLFPSSGGANPSLTIVANTLRITQTLVAARKAQAK